MYSGSRSSNEPKDMPPIIASLVDKINEKYCSDGEPKINSVLINRYKINEGFLPEHSDNEPVIHPESDIMTLSVGGVCDVLFTTVNKDHPDPYTYTHRCNPRSVYLMTRRSQAHFKHSISQGSVTGSMRYSLTFRSLSPFNRSATCIFSDSNGAGMRFGSEPKRSFGKWLPGKNFFTPVIDNIDPFLTCGYKNVVILCGINDVRKPSVKSQRDVYAIYSLLEYKIEQIQEINPVAQIFVCPLLPTKNADLNRKVLYFIDLIRRELLPKNFGVQMVDGFDDFLDNNTGLLCQALSREFDKYGRPDVLHLNWKGVAKLSVMIRNTVLLRMNGGIDKRRKRNGRVNGTPYSAAAGGENHVDGYQPPT